MQINANRIVAKNINNIYGIALYDYIGNIQNSVIANNFISLYPASGSATGITLDHDSILGIYYNSISIVGNNSNSNTLNIQSSSGLVFKNNIISNTAFCTAINAGICNQCQSDYNDIYSNGTLAKLEENIIPNIQTWAVVTQDSNSISVFPKFISDTNLHTTNIFLNGKAIPITGITLDIDNQLRNALTPDIGADEFDPPAFDLQLIGYVETPKGCGLTNNEKIEVIVENAGTSNYIAGNASIKYLIEIPQQFVNETINRDIASGDTIHYVFASGANLSVNNFLHDTTFLIKSWIDYAADSNAINDSISTFSFSRYLPVPPLVSDTIIPYATSVSIYAQVPPDYFPIWYESLSSINSIKVGNPITSPILYLPDSVYVSSRRGELDYAEISSFNNTTSVPFLSDYSDSRTQIIYTADELRTAGLIPGNIISLAFYISYFSNTMMNGFNINMQNTSLSTLTTFAETGWTNVFSGTYSVSDYGWQEIIFQNPFIWDGNSNVLVNICFDNNSAGSYSAVYCSAIQGKTIYGYSNSEAGCNITGSNMLNYQPDIRFKGTKIGSGCESIRIPLHVNISNTPSKDIGVISIITPNSGFELSNVANVGVIVKNYGATTIDTMLVSYQKNDTTLAVTETIIRSLASGDTLHYYFIQTADISTLGTYNLKAYTSLLGDTIYLNDTIRKIVGNYTYCTSATNYGCYYASINNFKINTLENNNSGCNNETGSYINYPENMFTTALQKNISYPFSITTAISNYNIGYGIWIDLNHDGDFDDAEEFLFNTYYYGLECSGNISIPSTYNYVGKTRMRVRAVRYNYLYSYNSCTSFWEYGETEDYTITILPEPSQIDIQLVNIIKPNDSIYQLVPTDVIVQIKNIGLDTITQIPLNYTVNAQNPVSYTWNGQLLPQQFIDVNLPQLTATTANNSFSVFAGLIGDMNNTNDTLNKNFVALPAPALMHIEPDTLFGMIASCDSSATQTLSFSISNIGSLPLNYSIIKRNGINENFEANLNKWISNGSWGIINQGYNDGYALTESPAGNYGNNWNIDIQLKDSLYIANKDSCKLQYMLKYAVESCCDRLNAQISVNGGSWITLYSHGSSGSENWSLKQIPFNSYVNIGDYIKFRFLFTSDYSVVSDGVLIDNFTINGIQNGTWATLSKTIDTVAAGDTSFVNVTFNVGQLNAGNYSQNLTIISNDPFSPNTRLPIYFTIIGAPQIFINDSIYNFPSIMAGAMATKSFKIYNTGCDSLKISAINHTDAAFTTEFPPFVMPKDSAIITINFNTLVQGLHNDTLAIANNSELKHLYVSGTILPTPKLTLVPDSFYVTTSNCVDTFYYNMIIKNTGNTTLNWNANYSKGAEKALAFNGNYSEVKFGDFGQTPQKGSVEFWMKANSNSGFRILYSSSGLSNNWKGINVYQSDNYLYLIVGNDNGNTYNSYAITSNIDYGKWHHVAVTWDIAQNKVWTYFDGSVYLNGSYNPYWPTTISDVRLGIGYSNYYSYYFNGEIDEFRMWNKNCTSTDINDLYKEGFIAPSPSLTGQWSFNEASGDTVYSFNAIPKKGILYNVSRVNSGAEINNTGIDVYPFNGVLADGDSSNVQVTFVTTELNSGHHYSGIGITSNDPLKSFTILPTHLALTGSPQLKMLATDLTMNSIMAGATITDSMQFTNIGCDTLKITNIVHTDSVFSIDQSSFTLLPKDTVKLKITFNPVNVGNYTDTMQFISNSGNQQLIVYAVAVAAPVASVSPNSFSDTLTTCNQSVTEYFKIKNTGNEVLNWSGLMGGVGMSDNFNNGINNSNWSNISNASAASSCGTALGDNALYFGGDGVRSATTKTLNTIGGGNIAFYIKISGSGGSPCEQADYGEDVVLEYSTNNSSIWNIIQTYYTGSYSYFTAVQTSIPIGAQSFNTNFRWRQLTHSGSCCDHWSIDEVNINTVNINNIIPSSGTINIGDSSIVQLIVDGQDLINGNYLSQLLLNTNDPIHPQITIPVQLVISANPMITITNNPLVMDTVMIGTSTSKSLFITNTGCDSLKITNITHNLSEFTYNPSSLTILPKDSAAITVTFSSLNVGNYIDTLKIINNAAISNVVIKARAVGAPEIITLPDQITADFACDSQITIPFKIKNPGIVPLNWNAFVENQEKGALQFNGVNNYVSSGNWTPGTKWTVEAWVKPDVLTYGNRLIAGSSYPYYSWGICMVDKKFAATYRSSQTGYSQTLIVNDTLPTGIWYHVACAFNGSTIRLYINGQLIKSALVNSNYTAYSYPFIGGDPSYGNYFSGSIDEVRIWDRERSQSQISYAMNHILLENESGLLGYWGFNKVNGNIVSDLSGNGHNGTLSGATYTTNTSPTLGWVNISNYSGSINVNDSTQINVNINRHLLPQGSYPFKLIVQSDDPTKPFDTTLITVGAQYSLTPVDLGSDTNLCTGNALPIFAGNYSSYTWNDNSHNSTLSITNSGTYYVSVIDANSCVFSDTVQIGLTQPPVANAGLDKTICKNSSVSLNGSASGGTSPYQYIWKNETQTIVSNYANYGFTPTNSTMHFLSIIDNNSCASVAADTVNITVNPNPIVNAGSDTTINLGTSALLNGSISGGTYPYVISWGPSNYLSSTNIVNPIATPTYSTNFWLTVVDANNCTANDNTYIYVKYTISGKVVYKNSLQTPMPSVWVYLANTSDIIIDSVLTSGSGTFIFSKVSYGNYYVYAKPTVSYGGLNSTDALMIRRHIVNISLLGGITLKAADVNNSNTVSSADALLILRRTVGLSTSFPSGDWTSEKQSLNYLSNNVQNLVIKTLCMGDVNGSYSIYSTKTTEGLPQLTCIPTKTNLIAGETFNLPISVKQNIKPGAITLNFQFPDNLIDIIGVSSNGTDVEFRINNGVLSIGAYNEKGMILNDNILLLIKCRVKPDVQNKSIGISLLNQSEIADIEGNVLLNLQLETTCLNIVEQLNEFKMEDNFPNPFNSTTTIRVYIPEEATLHLSVLNTLGVEIKSISTEKLSIGWHELQIDAKDLSQGSYMYRLQAIGKKNSFEQTRRMMIIR